jgi:hypothetical protein
MPYAQLTTLESLAGKTIARAVLLDSSRSFGIVFADDTYVLLDAEEDDGTAYFLVAGTSSKDDRFDLGVSTPRARKTTTARRPPRVERAPGDSCNQ